VLCVLLITQLAQAGSSATEKTETASSGNVSAVLSYTENHDRYSNLRIRIVRAGVTARDDPVPCGPTPSFQCSGPGDSPAPLNAGLRKSIRARNLDEDSEPEVIADFFTGGAYCCIFSLLYDFSGGSGYSQIVWPWGSVGYRLRDVGGTPAPEFSSHDYRFDGVFCAHVCSGYPVQIWRLSGGRFTDATRRFPVLVRREARAHFRLYRRLRGRRNEDVKGVLAAYAADEYLLGRERQASRALRRARRAGDLDRGQPPRGSAYLRRLRRFLRRTGYAIARTGGSRSRASAHHDAGTTSKCSKKAARAAILGSSFGRSIRRKLRRFVKVGAGPILGYGIWKLLCKDVTRDGRKEMIVALTCCTSGTPTPWAIFERQRRAWRPVFQVVSRKVSLWGLRVNADSDVIEKLPRFKPGDALCCPSSFSYRMTHWNGSRFVVRRLQSNPGLRSTVRKDVREFIRRLEAVGLTVESTPGHYRVLRDGKPLRKANGMPFMLPFSPDTIRWRRAAIVELRKLGIDL
jgi:hypothetical protein